MSKSEGSYIALTDDPHQMYGKTMSLPDEVLIQMFTDCTLLPLKDIDVIKDELASGANPRDSKMKLAREIVALYHGGEDAEKAESQFVAAFQNKAAPEDIDEVQAGADTLLVDVLMAEKVVSSRNELRRLIDAGAVVDMDTQERVSDIQERVKGSRTLRVGKHRFIKILTDA